MLRGIFRTKNLDDILASAHHWLGLDARIRDRQLAAGFASERLLAPRGIVSNHADKIVLIRGRSKKAPPGYIYKWKMLVAWKQ